MSHPSAKPTKKPSPSEVRIKFARLTTMILHTPGEGAGRVEKIASPETAAVVEKVMGRYTPALKVKLEKMAAARALLAS